MASSNDISELEAIERAAQSAGGGPPPPAPKPAPGQQGGRRRGSSMFSPGGAMAEYKAQMAAAAGGGGSGGGGGTSDLLEPFPGAGGPVNTSGSSAPMNHASQINPTEVAASTPHAPHPMGGPVKRNSVVLKPMVGIGGLDFDSDFDDSDEDDDKPPLPGAPMPGSAAPGGQNHRPMVGGFAAAAYEAARAHHYASVNRSKKHLGDSSKRSGPPPSI